MFLWDVSRCGCVSRCEHEGVGVSMCEGVWGVSMCEGECKTGWGVGCEHVRVGRPCM